MKKVLALDIGEVCIKLHHLDALLHFGLDPRQPLPPEFLVTTDRFERGQLPEAEWIAGIKAFFHDRFSVADIVDGWNKIIGEPIPGMPELLRELADQDWRLVFFSDTSTLHMAKLQHDGVFTELSTGAILSYEVGAKKPEDAMYEAFEHAYGKPDLYLDDRADNIAAGVRRGWPSLPFTGVAALREYLRR